MQPGKRSYASGASSGLTLVELLVALAVFAVFVTMAVPSYTNFIANQRVRTVAQDLFTALVLARSEAIKRNSDVILTSNDNWNGWAITVDAAKTYDGCLSDSANCLQIHGELIGVSVGAGAPATLTYDRTGRIGGVASFSLCDSRARAAVMRRIISIDPSGRPNITQSGTCG
jgi:type IV fimbrial biogenesis protein FimT